MPYIAPFRRPQLDALVQLMIEADLRANGDLNYILYAFCVRNITPGYGSYKNFCGELRQCATEIERRLLGPYEDKKIEENGDQ